MTCTKVGTNFHECLDLGMGAVMGQSHWPSVPCSGALQPLSPAHLASLTSSEPCSGKYTFMALGGTVGGTSVTAP